MTVIWRWRCTRRAACEDSHSRFTTVLTDFVETGGHTLHWIYHESGLRVGQTLNKRTRQRLGKTAVANGDRGRGWQVKKKIK